MGRGDVENGSMSRTEHQQRLRFSFFLHVFFYMLKIYLCISLLFIEIVSRKMLVNDPLSLRLTYSIETEYHRTCQDNYAQHKSHVEDCLGECPWSVVSWVARLMKTLSEIGLSHKVILPLLVHFFKIVSIVVSRSRSFSVSTLSPKILLVIKMFTRSIVLILPLMICLPILLLIVSIRFILGSLHMHRLTFIGSFKTL